MRCFPTHSFLLLVVGTLLVQQRLQGTQHLGIHLRPGQERGHQPHQIRLPPVREDHRGIVLLPGHRGHKGAAKGLTPFNHTGFPDGSLGKKTVEQNVHRAVLPALGIVAVKEASGNLSSIAELFAECGDSFDIYSGNDDQIVPIMSLGGAGVISVLSNVLPKETHDITQLCLDGNYKEAAALQLKYLELINSLFCEVNPVPIKTAMAEMGFCDIEMRLPLCEMENTTKARLLTALKKHGLL